MAGLTIDYRGNYPRQPENYGLVLKGFIATHGDEVWLVRAQYNGV